MQGIYTPEFNYIGSSSDTKPTLGVRKGSVFFELDTMIEYIWDGTTWQVNRQSSFNKVWNPSTLAWEAMVQPLLEADNVTVSGSVSVSNIASTPLITGFATSAKQLADGHNVNVSNIANTPVITGYATSAKQLADGHNVAAKLYGYTGTVWKEAKSDSSNGNLITCIGDQEIVVDANNTFSGTINGNATKTCTGTNITNMTAIQVYLQADQNCKLFIDQADVAVNLGGAGTVIDSFNYYSSIGNGSFTVVSVAPYYRVRVQNLSSSIANIILASAPIPILNTLPRSLDDEGLLQIGIKSIRGKMGRVRISPMGAMKTATSVRLAGASFIGGTTATPIALDTSFWATTAVGSGAVTQKNGEATLTTAATADSSCLINSVRIARYIGGCPNYYRGNVQLPTVTTDTASYVNIRRWGAFDADNGYFFRAIQTNPATTSTLSVVSRKETSDTNITSFNGDYGTTFTLDTNIHTYEIWWSNKNAYFFVDDILLHTISAVTTTSVGTPSLKVGLQTINSGGNTAANTLVVRSSMIMRLGNLTTQPTNYYFALGTTAGVQIKLGAGNLRGVILNNVVNNAVITLSDGTAGATPVIFLHTAGATNTAPVQLDFGGVPFSNGLRLTVASQNASLTVIYE